MAEKINMIKFSDELSQVTLTVVDSTEIVAEAQRIHGSKAVVTAALGRLLTATSIMGAQLKNDSDTVTLRVEGGGPIGRLITVSDSHGDVRGYATNVDVDIPRKYVGKLDVGGAVGKDGVLYVIRENAGGKPYIGQTPLISGEIAEDITHYYATSEQDRKSVV